MTLIGSIAIKHWYPDFPREPKDMDIIRHRWSSEDPSSKIIEENGKFKTYRIEYHENPIFFKYSDSIMSPNDLCTLKASHLCWDINWEKHMFDTQFLLKKGCKINPKLYKALYNHWNVFHTKNKRSDLKMSKADFFTNAINYNEAEHDYLHTLINPTPTFTKVLKDGCEVELDENKFHNLSLEEKLNFVREEVMVMAYERFRDKNYKSAYSKMLKKFILSHAPIWSVIFIIENYIELNKCQTNFINQIENGLKTA